MKKKPAKGKPKRKDFSRRALSIVEQTTKQLLSDTKKVVAENIRLRNKLKKLIRDSD